jgi:hypothetical protein
LIASSSGSKNDYDLARLRARVERTRLHADLAMLASLGQGLFERARQFRFAA